jgi:hypothetical protein
MLRKLHVLGLCILLKIFKLVHSSVKYIHTYTHTYTHVNVSNVYNYALLRRFFLLHNQVMSYTPIRTVQTHWQSIMPTHTDPVKTHELTSLSYCKFYGEYEHYDPLIRAKRIANVVIPSEPLFTNSSNTTK